MKLFVASDHAGFALRQKVLAHLRAKQHEVHDMGAATAERSDYPDYAAPVGHAVREASGSLGILVCGSGTGMCIAANKISGIRAVQGFSIEAARMARSHNDANVVCLGERFVPPDTALAIVEVFLNTAFEGGRHSQRLEKLAALEADFQAGSGDAKPGAH